MAEDFSQDPENIFSNTLTLGGMTFVTSGNILFQESTRSQFYLAESPLLQKIDTFLENGMHLFLKKLKG